MIPDLYIFYDQVVLVLHTFNTALYLKTVIVPVFLSHDKIDKLYGLKLLHNLVGIHERKIHLIRLI